MGAFHSQMVGSEKRSRVSWVCCLLSVWWDTPLTAPGARSWVIVTVTMAVLINIGPPVEKMQMVWCLLMQFRVSGKKNTGWVGNTTKSFMAVFSSMSVLNIWFMFLHDLRHYKTKQRKDKYSWGNHFRKNEKGQRRLGRNQALTFTPFLLSLSCFSFW